MPAISVAVDGDVTATPGSITTVKDAQSGKWTAGTISYKTYPKLKVNGKPVIHEASCTFTFSGTNSSGATVTGSETVKLSAGTTKLQKGADKVLKDGDQASDSYGNMLKVSATGKLRTS